MELVRLRQIPPSLFEGIIGGEEHRTGQVPQPRNACVRKISRGEEDVGVKEEPIHQLHARGPSMRNVGGIQSHFTYFEKRVSVVIGIDGIGEEKLRLALIGVEL